MKTSVPISRKLMQLGRVYQHALARQVEHLDISRYHDILAIIYYHNGQLTQKALAGMLNKDKSAMVSIIDQLTQKGYVYREINPADRREHLLKITAKAEQEVPAIISAFEKMNKSSTENISAADMEIFNSVLVRMENNLKHHLTTEDNQEPDHKRELS